MPGNDEHLADEDLTPLHVRVPRSVIAQIDVHVRRLRRAYRWVRISRSDALRDLIMRAAHALEDEGRAPEAPAARPATQE